MTAQPELADIVRVELQLLLGLLDYADWRLDREDVNGAREAYTDARKRVRALLDEVRGRT